MDTGNTGLRARWTLLAVAAATAAVAFSLAGATAGARNGPTLSVNVDRTTIYRNEQLSVDIVMSGEYDDLSGPSLDGFDILGRSEGRSFSFGMGGSTSERTISLTLAPTKTGKLLIGAARLTDGGKVVASSRPVEITVRDEDAPVTRQRQGRRSGIMSLFPQIATPQMETVKAPLVEARLFPPEAAAGRPVYPGQPLILKYVLLTPMPPEYWSVAVTAKPDMKGLVVRESPRGDEKTAEVRRDDGIWYETVIWKAAVTPIDPGAVEIGPMRLDAGFRGFQNFSVASGAIDLTVAPIPSEGTPDGFVPGTLGSFRMEARLENPRIALGESATLTVTVKGSGNIAAVAEPAISVPDGLKVDEFANGQAGDEIVIGDEGMTGTKTFKFLLTPGRMPDGKDGGDFTIGVAPLVYFDYASGSWERAAVEDLTLEVRGSTLADKRDEARVPQLGVIEKSSLRPPAPQRREWYTGRLVAGLMAVPVLLLAVVEIVAAARRRLAANGFRSTSRKALKKALAELARLERDGGGDAAFWTELEMIIRRFVEARFGIGTGALTGAAIASELARRGAPTAESDALLDLLNLCSLARFAGQHGAGDAGDAARRVRECLSSLDRAGGAS